MTNLTEKLDDLRTQMTAQHNAVITAIGANTVQLSADLTGVKTRLDTIIEKLGGINTTLSNNGTVDTASIVDAINNLRGNSVETANDTLYSINKSLWNLAGTAPGASLLQLLEEIQALRGTGGPETTLRSINQSLWNLAGPAPGASLIELNTTLEKIVDTLGDPAFIDPIGLTVRGLLEAIRAQWESGQGLSAYNLLDTIYQSLVASGTTQSASKDILTRLIYQFDVSVVTPTMKDLMLVIADNTTEIAGNTADIADNTTDPTKKTPAGACASPLMSTGTEVDPISNTLIAPVTIATWPTPLPAGWPDFSTNGYNISCTDWSKYRVYVASRASTFGLVSFMNQRYPTNQWLSVDPGEAHFTVDGAGIDIKVSICPIDSGTGGGGGGDPNPNLDLNPDPGGCSAAAWAYESRITEFEVLGSFSNGLIDYNVYAPLMPLVPELLEYEGGNPTIARVPDAFVNLPANSRVQLCMSWDFTGNDVWSEVRELRGNDVFIVGLPTVFPISNLVGKVSYLMQSQNVVSYRFAAPANIGMPSNVFVHVMKILV